MKQKFQALDVSAIVSELKQSIVGLRLQNVYDISPKVYLFKFAKPEQKHVLLIESGIRLHLTEYARDKGNNMPGGFCMKIRKHLRTRRLTDVAQLGTDRVIDFTFGQGEGGYHIITEFYASGNIILTDHEYRILSLLRVVSPDENTRMAVGEIYNTQTARQFSGTTPETLKDILMAAPGKDQVRRLLSTKMEHSPQLIEHCLIQVGLEPTIKASAFVTNQQMNAEKLDQLHKALLIGDDIVREILQTPQKGYIIQQDLSKSKSGTEETALVYDDFHPILYAQFASGPYREFASFNLAVDEYFSSMESQKTAIKARQQEETALKKLEHIRNEQDQRIDALSSMQLTNERKAQLIEMNLESVDAAITILRSALASGMDWVALKELVEEEKESGNPIASMIHGLKLETNQVTLLLQEPTDMFADSDEDDEDDEGNSLKRAEKVDVNIGLSAYANARRFYDDKKKSAVKQEKTVKAATKAMKAAEKKIMQEMKQVKAPPVINKMRKPFWFEKFIWFISSENYLVVGGRDAQQNEYLVKRHLKKDDVYVHADIVGSASIIVKNPTTDPIPPITLSQAGTMAICNSRAWDAKIVTSAYWVNAEQVSKTAPTGEYLTTGSFMIRGKKNYLPPSQLIYGFGVLFRVSEECIARHYHERRPQLRNASDESLNQSNETVDESVEADNDDDEQEGEKEDELPTISQLNLVTDKYNLREFSNSQEVEELISPVEKTVKQPHNNQKKNQKSGGKGRQPEQVQEKKEKAPGQIRGKKGKLKKMKEKYGDQDDEERAARMAVLGSSGGKKPQTTDEKSDDAVQEKTSTPDLGKQEPIHSTEDLAAKEKEQDEPEVSQEADEEEQREIRQLLEEENVPVDESELTTTFLDSLTGQPHADDILLYAIPVCAPYVSIQSYKYRVKLMPGGMKKGKASQAAMHLFMNQGNTKSSSKEKLEETEADQRHANLTKRERELMRQITDQEMIQSMLGKSKVLAAGITQLKKNAKNKRKGK